MRALTTARDRPARSGRQPQGFARPGRSVLGATLIEAVLVLSLLALAAGALHGFLKVASVGTALTEQRLDLLQSARRGLERIAEEIRWAEAVVGVPTCGPTGLCADRVTVRIPAGNPYRADQPYEVTFQHNSRQREIERRVGGGTNNLSSHVERLELAYFDPDGRVAHAPESVVRVRVTATLRARGGHPLTLTGDAALRNRRPQAPSSHRTPAWRPTPRGFMEPPTGERTVLPPPPPTSVAR